MLFKMTVCFVLMKHSDKTIGIISHMCQCTNIVWK